MCGIAGKYNFGAGEPVDRGLLKRMSASIAHRGPDDEGVYTDDQAGVGLAHRRLSIIDLSTGHQPMSDERAEIWIVFNGEIYNFPELKKELIAKGRVFRTTSDTEVIISMYADYGTKAFARLNGIFSFAIYDKRSRTLILARDHFGVKPLYYATEAGTLTFGSEIKAILEDPSIPRDLDYEALNTFLTFRYNPSPQTLFKGIRKVPPGHFLSVQRGGSMSVTQYAHDAPATQAAITMEEAVPEYQRLLQAAVKRQMISDVPVGLLLSGGVDSAALGYLMQGSVHEPIKTFTIGFPGSGDFNELEEARRTAAKLGSDHHELVISRQDYIDFFLKSFVWTEEPIAETTIPALYYVARLASQHLKVVLAGQGADEPLGGYHRYLGEKFLAQFGPLLSRIPLKWFAGLLPRNEQLKRALYAADFSSEVERFLGIYTIFTPAMKSRLVKPEVAELMVDANESLIGQHHRNTAGLADSLGRLMYIDTRMSLPDDLLLFGDKMTMANALEMRVPFLDLDLVTFLESLPSSFKIHGITRKYIHKKAISRWLPPDIIHRKKKGFATPMDGWLQQGLTKFAKDLLTNTDSASARYFNLAYINSLIDDHRGRRQNYQRHIFALLSFELWHRRFFQHVDFDDASRLLV